ncbi:MAG TPA: ABC transporter ATP-binding protein [Thermoanaerobaculia bacterium]|nr:ABC transporter ATP-binding protein [Thermoanaerobaculia bacterium]
MTTLLEVSGLTAKRGGRVILSDVSFGVQPSEILGVIGPNGAGKTTLFECVAGLLPIESGTISRNAESFYMPDAIRPWPEQTVRWTVEMNARAFGGGTNIDAALEALDLTRLASQRVVSLSKGETKRLNIAMALAAPHPILFLDEPFDGLDLRQTRAAMALLRGVVEQGRTLVLSIHELVDAERICDRLLLLSGGRSIAEGTVEALRAQASVAEGGLEEVFLALT